MSYHRDPYSTFSAERPFRFEDLEKALANGKIGIETCTLPSGNEAVLAFKGRHYRWIVRTWLRSENDSVEWRPLTRQMGNVG